MTFINIEQIIVDLGTPAQQDDYKYLMQRTP